jgi:glycine/D-amino acid oxidase-like deaminating enzyme
VEPIIIVGGGLAGCEAAWQVARAGLRSILYEMRPVRSTNAHQTGLLAELVCSNSLKSESENSAPWLLKEELRRLDSLLLQAAAAARVPGGHALTVDREMFAGEVSRAIERNRWSSYGARRLPPYPGTASPSSPPAPLPATRWLMTSRSSLDPPASISTTASAPSSKPIP